MARVLQTTTIRRQAAKPRDPRRRILAAAIECFEKHGPAKTTMEDVAVAAGLARKTVYRAFGSRTELLEAVAVTRLDQMVAQVRIRLRLCRSLKQAIVIGSQEIIRVARADALFIAVVDAASDKGLMRYFVDPQSPILRHAQSLWEDTLAKARERGELNTALSDLDIENWMRAVHLILFLRDDLDAAGQARLLETFVTPALIAPARPSGS
jgi:AcrR family transcriptional regulator